MKQSVHNYSGMVNNAGEITISEWGSEIQDNISNEKYPELKLFNMSLRRKKFEID